MQLQQLLHLRTQARTSLPGLYLHRFNWLCQNWPNRSHPYRLSISCRWHQTAALGTDSRNGVEIAIDDAGGKILGHTIKFDGEDGGCSADGGQAAGTKLAADPTIVAVIGTSCSSEARAAEPLLSAAGFVTISSSNTAPDLTDPTNPNHYPGYFRTAHNDKIQGCCCS